MKKHFCVHSYIGYHPAQKIKKKTKTRQIHRKWISGLSELMEEEAVLLRELHRHEMGLDHLMNQGSDPIILEEQAALFRASCSRGKFTF